MHQQQVVTREISIDERDLWLATLQFTVEWGVGADIYTPAMASPMSGVFDSDSSGVPGPSVQSRHVNTRML